MVYFKWVMRLIVGESFAICFEFAVMKKAFVVLLK